MPLLITVTSSASLLYVITSERRAVGQGTHVYYMAVNGTNTRSIRHNSNYQADKKAEYYTARVTSSKGDEINCWVIEITRSTENSRIDTPDISRAELLESTQ